MRSESVRQHGCQMLLLAMLVGCGDAGRNAGTSPRDDATPPGKTHAQPAEPTAKLTTALHAAHAELALAEKEQVEHSGKLRKRLSSFLQPRKSEMRWRGGKPQLDTGAQGVTGQVTYEFAYLAQDASYVPKGTFKVFVLHYNEVKARYVWSGKAWTFAEAAITPGQTEGRVTDPAAPRKGKLLVEEAQLRKILAD